MRVFSSLILMLSFQFSFACVENGFTTENVRISLFEAKRTGFSGLMPFYYSADRYYNTSDGSLSDSDYFAGDSFKELRDLNCLEWKNKLGNQIKVNDIYAILYKTDSREFIKAYETKSLAKRFKKNSFINNLILPNNRELLNCVLFAKKIEYNNNRWGFEMFSIDIDEYKKKLFNTKDVFLKQRYAFLLLKYYFYKENSKEVFNLYKNYFGKNLNTVLEFWALDYSPQTLNKTSSGYYSLYNYLISSRYKPSMIIYNKDVKSTLHEVLLPENNNLESVDIAIDNFRNPGQCLDEIKKMARLSPNNFLLAFLIGREISKIEDWIFTPQYTNYISSVVYANYRNDFEEAKKENYIKDILYLRKLRSFLVEMRKRTSGEQKDFVTAVIAQLYFIDNNIDKGKVYTNMITENANASIQMQKNIQLALISLKENDLSDKKVQNQLAFYFSSVENLVRKDEKLSKCLYSLYSVASEEFSKQGEEAIAGLLFIKAQLTNWGSNYFDYDYIGYFERHASVDDVNYLIALHKKKNKTLFEKLIASKTMKKDVNFYKDLLGTIAFRNNDLEFAEKVFKSMTRDFWNKSKMFKELLNENPFQPKVLLKRKERIYNYNFNKADFVSKIIQLKKQNTVASYMQLANAYYNVSYFGNSWAMTSYDRFNKVTGWFEYLDDNQDLKAKYQNGNYYNLTIAKMYYEKALKLSRNKEEKAYANLMLFRCKYDRYQFSGFNSYELTYFPIRNKLRDQYPLFYENFYPDNDDRNFKGLQELVNFYSIYKLTETFKKYDCPLLREFIN
jgi:hypothetical protein